MMWCSDDEETYLPMDADGNAESFGQLLKADAAAREAIDQKNSADFRIAQEMRSRPKKAEKTIEHIRGILVNEMDGGGLTQEEAEAADHILGSADLRQWVEHLEDLLDSYDANHDVRSLVSQLKKIGDSIGAGDNGPGGADEEPGPLVLVGAMFITA